MQTGTFNPFIDISENIFHLLIKFTFHYKKSQVYIQVNFPIRLELFPTSLA